MGRSAGPVAVLGAAYRWHPLQCGLAAGAAATTAGPRRSRTGWRLRRTKPRHTVEHRVCSACADCLVMFLSCSGQIIAVQSCASRITAGITKVTVSRQQSVYTKYMEQGASPEKQSFTHGYVCNKHFYHPV